MIVLYVLLAVVIIAIVWAIASSASGKPKASEPTYELPQAPKSAYKPELDLPKANSWEDGARAGVSKTFGSGGEPIGTSRDPGGLAVSSKEEADDDFNRLKNARAFEPRALPTNYEESEEEVSDPV